MTTDYTTGAAPMHHLLIRTPSRKLRTQPLTRRLLGDSSSHSSEALVLLAIFVCQRPGIAPATFKTGKEYNRACKRAGDDMKALKRDFAQFVALGGTDDDLLEANVQKALTLNRYEDGFVVKFTPTQGSTYRSAVQWLLERANHNIATRRHRADKQETREVIQAHQIRADAARRAARNQQLVDNYNARVARENGHLDQRLDEDE
jgi:hypothetical protein